MTQRYKAEYGRSNGGVMNIVTKSGTNNWRGSWFTSGRDKSLNAKTNDRENRHDRQRRPHGAAQGRVPALSVRRVVRRPHRAEQGALLRRLRAHAAGHDAVGEHAGPVPGRGRRVRDAEPREPVHGQGLDQLDGVAVHVGALRPQHQLAGLQRADAPGADELGRQSEQVQLDQPESQLGARRHQAERVRVPVRRLQQSHRRPHRRGAEHLPERRPRRRQRQHAAVDGAAQVPVP